jgi:caa(3)-type oxidase subunit IV
MTEESHSHVPPVTPPAAAEPPPTSTPGAVTESRAAELFHDDHDGPSLKTYQIIFGALLGFTLISFVANELVRHQVISTGMSFTIIMGVAVCKATLVGAYFMHLVLDWGKVMMMILPALILGPMLMIVLLPDIVLAWVIKP